MYIDICDLNSYLSERFKNLCSARLAEMKIEDMARIYGAMQEVYAIMQHIDKKAWEVKENA